MQHEMSCANNYYKAIGKHFKQIYINEYCYCLRDIHKLRYRET